MFEPLSHLLIIFVLLCRWFLESAKVYSPFVMLQLISCTIIMAIVILYFDRVKTQYYSTFYRKIIKKYWPNNFSKSIASIWMWWHLYCRRLSIYRCSFYTVTLDKLPLRVIWIFQIMYLIWVGTSYILSYRNIFCWWLQTCKNHWFITDFMLSIWICGHSSV